MAPNIETPPDTPPSCFTCPECHGALWELKDGKISRYRCRIGHAYNVDSLMAFQSAHVEEAMWAAYRALEEAAALADRLAGRSRADGLPDVAHLYDAKRDDAIARSRVIRRALEAEASPAAAKLSTE